MRIKIHIQTNKIPLAYRMGVVSLFKEAIKKSDKNYFDQLYSERKMRPYCFAPYLVDAKIENNSIELKQMLITVSSPDTEFLLHLYNGLNKLAVFKYKDSDWHRKKVEMLREKDVTSSIVVMRTLSPLLIEDKTGKPLSPEDENFEDQFNYYANLTVKEMYGRNLVRNFRILNHSLDKTVIKEKNQYWGSNNYMYLTAYKGMITLEGAQEDIKCIYQAGVSRRRSQGFGLLDIERMGVN